MSMVEISLNTLGIEVESPTDEQVEAGMPAHVVVQVTGGSMIPLRDPNTGGPIIFPSFAVNYSLDKTAALELAKLLTEKADALPDKPAASGKLIQASSLAEAEAVARQQSQFKV